MIGSRRPGPVAGQSGPHVSRTRRRPGLAAFALGAVCVSVVLAATVDRGSPSFISSASVELAIPEASGSQRVSGAHAPTEALHTAGLEIDEALLEPGPFGPLPRIGPSGRRPFFAYANPIGLDDSRPKIAVVVLGLGLQRAATDAALELPASVGLQFSAYAPDLHRDVARARQHGHEVLLSLPMEPEDYPANDPGPHTLTVDARPQVNLERLHWILARTNSYIGLAGDGGRFAASRSADPIVADLVTRGLALIEIGTSGLTEEAGQAGLLYARAAEPIDADLSPLSIDYALAGLEAEALETGSALGVISARPMPMARLAEWARSLEGKGLVLAPVSALLVEGAGLAAQLRGESGAARPDRG
jgi:polysaccharide deacetylase 2 family uncharacterized protein YibQ